MLSVGAIASEQLDDYQTSSLHLIKFNCTGGESNIFGCTITNISSCISSMVANVACQGIIESSQCYKL